MKKHMFTLSLSVAAVAFASGAYAQNINNQAYVDQVGPGNSFIVDQGGSSNIVRGGGANAMTNTPGPFRQQGSGNYFNLSQQGSGNQHGVNGDTQGFGDAGAGLSQNPAAQIGNNNASTIQINGSGNGAATAAGGSGKGQVFQEGSGNTANLTINGSNNSYLIDQFRLYGLGGGFSERAGNNNTANFTITGSSNRLTSLMDSNLSDFAGQINDNNNTMTANIIQSGLNPGLGNTFRGYQAGGSNNMSFVGAGDAGVQWFGSQSGGTGNQIAAVTYGANNGQSAYITATQSGAQNSALLYQQNQGNGLYTSQSGTGNSVIASQGNTQANIQADPFGGLYGSNTGLNVANITQSGNSNSSTGYQIGDGAAYNYVTVSQTGNNHAATYSQTGGSGNNVSIVQH